MKLNDITKLGHWKIYPHPHWPHSPETGRLQPSHVSISSVNTELSSLTLLSLLKLWILSPFPHGRVDLTALDLL